MCPPNRSSTNSEFREHAVRVMRMMIRLRPDSAEDEVAAGGEMQVRPRLFSGIEVPKSADRRCRRKTALVALEPREVFAESSRGAQLDDVAFVRFGTRVAHVEDRMAADKGRVEDE